MQTLLVMELCERSLAQHINAHVEAKTRMTEEEVLKAFAACSSAVGYMHSQTPPLIHRDVKPENLLLAPRWDLEALRLWQRRGGRIGDDHTDGKGEGGDGCRKEHHADVQGARDVGRVPVGRDW